MQTLAGNRARQAFEQRKMTESQVETVENLKKNAESLWNTLDNIAVAPGNSESGRLVALAKTSLEEAVMWGTKAVSRQTPPVT